MRNLDGIVPEEEMTILCTEGRCSECFGAYGACKCECHMTAQDHANQLADERINLSRE